MTFFKLSTVLVFHEHLHRRSAGCSPLRLRPTYPALRELAVETREARNFVEEFTLADGTHLSERNDTVRGTPEDPMSKDEIIAKASDLITPVLGAETCTKLIEKVFGLEQMKDVRDLRPLLQRT